jgi:hypothetical protein
VETAAYVAAPPSPIPARTRHGRDLRQPRFTEERIELGGTAPRPHVQEYESMEGETMTQTLASARPHGFGLVCEFVRHEGGR